MSDAGQIPGIPATPPKVLDCEWTDLIEREGCRSHTAQPTPAVETTPTEAYTSWSGDKVSQLYPVRIPDTKKHTTMYSKIVVILYL